MRIITLNALKRGLGELNCDQSGPKPRNNHFADQFFFLKDLFSSILLNNCLLIIKGSGESQTLSHTLKLAPHERPSSQPLTKNPQQLCYFFAKPSRKTLNKFGKPSRTLIILDISIPNYEKSSVACFFKFSSILTCISTVAISTSPI